MIGADEKGEILCHETRFNCLNAYAFERCRKARQFLIVIKFRAMCETLSPSEDRGDRIGRGFLALLVFAIVARNGSVGRFCLNRLTIRCHEDRGHKAERAKALCDNVRLHVAIIVFARPHITARPFNRGRDHVVDQTMLISNTERLELALELGVKDFLEDVFEAAIIGLQDCVLR